MRVGVAIEETWDFFHGVYAELEHSFEVSQFKRRTFRLPIFNNRFNRMLYQSDMRNFLKGNQVVFFEWASQLLAEATRQPKTCGIVTRLHRYEMYQWVDQINWDRVDRVVLVSKAMQDEFLEKFPSQRGKTSVMNAGISLEKFTVKPRTFQGNIGILCHLTPRKRVYDLILAFAELCERESGFSLHIAGDDHPGFLDYANSLRYLVQQLGLEEKVRFYGFLPDPTDWYHHIDIFISNSYSEGLQVALIEAMASGCFSLSHGWKGVDELLPPENIYFTNKTMLEKILQFAHTSEAEKHVQSAQLRAIACEKCSVEDSKRHIKSVVQEVGMKYQRSYP
jgi:glycosyltransferase involved in cell wall biosynthesis